MLFTNYDRHMSSGYHLFFCFSFPLTHDNKEGVQWLSVRVLDSRPKGGGLEPHQHHCVVVLEQDYNNPS